MNTYIYIYIYIYIKPYILNTLKRSLKRKFMSLRTTSKKIKIKVVMTLYLFFFYVSIYMGTWMCCVPTGPYIYYLRGRNALPYRSNKREERVKGMTSSIYYEESLIWQKGVKPKLETISSHEIAFIFDSTTFC